jgi:two-component system chemotaxis response regulator CheB
MVVDDSALVRKVASDILKGEREIGEVVTASNAEIALRKLEKVKPDVITMDIEMPGMGGLQAISEIMRRRPTPVIVMSAFAERGANLTLQALERGTVDFIAKPSLTLSGGITSIAHELVEKVKHTSEAKVSKLTQKIDEGPAAKPEINNEKIGKKSISSDSSPYELIAIGTSTGGPVALKSVLCRLPAVFDVGIVVVQHMPPVFTKTFAERLNYLCDITVREARDVDEIDPGTVLIAPGDYHMTVTKFRDRPHIRLHKWEAVSGHRPSVDVLMHSVAQEYGSQAIGVIMTGMGKDGAEGIKELKRKGGYVIAQDKETSVIYGMNREVIENGDADIVVPIQDISKSILDCVHTVSYAHGRRTT